jgi:hypothetical protein
VLEIFSDDEVVLLDMSALIGGGYYEEGVIMKKGVL